MDHLRKITEMNVDERLAVLQQLSSQLRSRSKESVAADDGIMQQRLDEIGRIVQAHCRHVAGNNAVDSAQIVHRAISALAACQFSSQQSSRK
ncbi:MULTISPECIES: hypothetical protein [Rhizobium]|uniref:Uncharacterized protein n=1 Tax=Rhizobium favelukesii TaxID=348824 RepID=W6RP30_9HYPH|nr:MULTISPECIES: hypothetical protein [Rhizobium]MCS0459189.1 hypothetical protein [Rhizobium favelukesii]UFS79012.1 hypothetical protein LPB79_05155 [Rhizobium sp. T136]CDM62499.1 hypothetical protein LPU83_pLPU83d_1129 [Rhizobium favelukesii]